MIATRRDDAERGNQKKVKAALTLLNREPKGIYIEEWTQLAAQPKEIKKEGSKSVILFRLGKEWLGLATDVFSEIISWRKIHTLPHRSGGLLKGVANYGGRLNLCVDMHKLLQVEQDEAHALQTKGNEIHKRLGAIQKENDLWLFPMDEVFGVYHFEQAEIANIPGTLAKASGNFLKGILDWKSKHIGYIDEKLLFESLRRSIL